METTRQTILGIIRRRQVTVEDLINELGLAPTTIRRHLDILIRDGHADVAQVRRKTGRPHFVFSITDAGEELFPKHYVRITRRLIEEIVALAPNETEGKSGSQLADLVFEKMAQRLAQRVAPHIHGSTLARRMQTTTEALAEEGIIFDVAESTDGYLLVGHGCPCPRVAEGPGQVCAHDQRLLSLLLAADVTAVDPRSVGQQSYCAYRVRERRPPDEPAAPADTDLPGAQSVVYSVTTVEN